MADVVDKNNAFTSMINMLETQQLGDSADYDLCKQIFIHHPLGAKMASLPIRMAMSKDRKIEVPNTPDTTEVKDAFSRTWESIGCDNAIFRLGELSRIYGIAALIIGNGDKDWSEPLKLKDIADDELFINVLDPLNTAGSLVLDQNPQSKEFQKPVVLTVAGYPVHSSRVVILMNGSPIYLAFSSSTFGFSGRSIYQPALYSLASFLQVIVSMSWMIRKTGVLIHKTGIKQAFIDKVSIFFRGVNANTIKASSTNNVLEIPMEDNLESINFTNANGVLDGLRKCVIEDIAGAAEMPHRLLLSDSYAQALGGSGSEDMKSDMLYIDGIRKSLEPAYIFLTRIVQYKAWTQEFYARIQSQHPEEYQDVDYKQARNLWVNSFTAVWPSLLDDADTESKREEVKLKAMNDAFMAISGVVTDGENKANMVRWYVDNLNELKATYPNPLYLDFDAMSEDIEAQKQQLQQSGQESNPDAAMDAL